MAASATQSLEIVVIADLDKKSKNGSEFVSFLQHGTLTRSGASYTVVWGDKQRVATSKSDSDGRGFELSELTWFQGQLLTFDDRTGVVYELTGFTDPHNQLQAVPQRTITEGDGTSGQKGQKHEWATVKDGELYMGSNGLTAKDKSGAVKRANEWVAVADVHSTVRREDWASRYARVREALGVSDRGYVSHEAVEWSSAHNEWFLLPRRVSSEPFDAKKDPYRGATKLVIASEDFQQIEVVEIRGKTAAPERGFSSFKFVPNTDDRVIMAIKSVEIGDKQDAFLTVFDIDGNVLLEDTQLPGGHKYEGVAFAQDWASDDAEELQRLDGCCVPWF